MSTSRGLFGGRPPTRYCCGSLVFPTGKLSPTLSLSLSLSLSLKLCDAGWFFNHIILLHRGQQNGRCRFRRNPFKHHDTTPPSPTDSGGCVCDDAAQPQTHNVSLFAVFFFICCVPFTAGRELIHFPPCASGKDVLTVNQCLWRVQQTTGDGRKYASRRRCVTL